ncbi:MAG: FimV/HubP family polar landmark protein, partial [Shewanella sp.]
TATEAQIEPLLATMPEHRQTPSDTEPELQLDLSDDSVLAAFTAQHLADDDDVLTTEDSFLLDGDHTLTVDEALAALDVQESRASQPFSAEHDLSRFQDDYGFIDIDKLLNDAEQDNAPVDLYPEVDVEMSNVEALIGDAAMIDVDDEENSVNAKLDLARAYIEIDDSDSAKALLKEVQIDGNERQQDEAIRLLKEIG